MTNTKQMVFLLCLVICGTVNAGQWTHWRGPNYCGSAGKPNIPEVESKGSPGTYNWKTPLPGHGSSTPVIMETNVFLTCEMPLSRDLIAMCIDKKTGRARWMRSAGKGSKVPESNMATPSPVTDGKMVFFMFGNGELLGIDVDGKIKWQRNIEKEYGKLTTRFGYSASPLLYQGKLYICVLRLDNKNIEPTEKKPSAASYFMAIDPATGTNLWKHTRFCDGREESQEAYTSPIPYEYKDRQEILVLGGDCLTGHDPKTGEEIWRWKGYNPKRITVGRIIPSPVVVDDMVIICGPRTKDVFAVRPNGKGMLDEKALAWKLDGRGSDSPTPLYYNGILYIMTGQYSSVKAVNPKNGNVLWEEKLESSNVFKASPLGVKERIYNINEDGEVFVMQAGKSFNLLDKKTFGGKRCRSSIATDGKHLFIRTSDRLYCVKVEDQLSL